MQSTILQTETTSNPFQELEAALQGFHTLQRLRLSAITAKRKVQAVRRFLTHLLLSKKHYKLIDKQDMEVFLALERTMPHTTQNTLFVVKEFYDYLLTEGIVTHNPAKDVTMRIRRHRPLTLVPAWWQVRNVLRKLEHNETVIGMQYRLMVELAYGSGLRAGEIAGLNIEDINIQDRTTHVLGKGQKERIVPLTTRTMELLKHYVPYIQHPRRYLFAQIKGRNKGQRLSSGSVSQAIKHKTGFHAHLLRHACATHMLQAGCNVRYIQELLGHEHLQTTTIYTNLNKEDLRLVVNEKHPGRMRSTMPNNPDQDPYLVEL